MTNSWVDHQYVRKLIIRGKIVKILDEEVKVGDRKVLVGQAKSRVISQLDVLYIYHNNFHEWMKDEYESHEVVLCAKILPTPACNSLDVGTQDHLLCLQTWHTK